MSTFEDLEASQSTKKVNYSRLLLKHATKLPQGNRREVQDEIQYDWSYVLREEPGKPWNEDIETRPEYRNVGHFTVSGPLARQSLLKKANSRIGFNSLQCLKVTLEAFQKSPRSFHMPTFWSTLQVIPCPMLHVSQLGNPCSWTQPDRAVSLLLKTTTACFCSWFVADIP